MTLIVNHPKELESFTAVPYQTLEGSEQNIYWNKELDKWISRLPGLREPRRPDGSGGSPPRPHQRRHACIALCRRHNFLSHSMGVGKSLQSVIVLLCQYGEQLFKHMDWDLFDSADANGQKKMIESARRRCTMRPGTIQIVAPRHILRQVWMRELARVGLDTFAEVIECESQLLNSRAPIFIYNFDLPKLQSDKGAALRRAKEGIRIRETGRPYFLGHPLAKVIARRRRPSLLIIDEIHKLKEGTERTRCMLLVRRKAKRVLGLTGTPMDGWVSHSATIFGFIYGEQTKPYPYTNLHFSQKFTKTKVVNTDIATGEETVGKERPVPGINHMQIPSFIRSTRHLMHRLNLTDPEVKANVVYPPTKSHEILIDMDKRHRAFYDHINLKARKGIEEELGFGHSAFKARINMLALINDLRLASKVPEYLGYMGESTQLTQKLVEIVKMHKAEGRKGLIGTTFIQESRLLHEALQRAGIKGCRVYADDEEAGKRHLSADDREALVERFQEDPDCWYLISNKELVAEGLNLSETASYTVSCSHGWRSNIEAQWLARVVRPGQLWPWVDCYTLLNRGTVDIYIDEMVRAKVNASNAMLDLKFEESRNDGAVINPLDLAKRINTGEDT